MPERMISSLRRAARLCGATVAWNTCIGGAGVATAVATGSLSLIGFGVNVVVDSSVSAMLVWRFRAEQAGHAARAIRAEQIALRPEAVARELARVCRLGGRLGLTYWQSNPALERLLDRLGYSRP